MTIYDSSHIQCIVIIKGVMVVRIEVADGACFRMGKVKMIIIQHKNSICNKSIMYMTNRPYD